MSIEKKLEYEAYSFHYEEDRLLVIKSMDEVNRINKILKEESPDSDYESYEWYLTAEDAEKLKYKKLKVTMQIAWHGGLPFYKLQMSNGNIYSIAEFYLQKYVKFKPDSEGLVLNDIFKNIPEEEGIHVSSRVPIKLGDLDVAFEVSQTWATGIESLIFPALDVEGMADDEIITLARTYPRADMFLGITIHRKKDVVYASFGYYNITRVPGSKRF